MTEVVGTDCGFAKTLIAGWNTHPPLESFQATNPSTGKSESLQCYSEDGATGCWNEDHSLRVFAVDPKVSHQH